MLNYVDVQRTFSEFVRQNGGEVIEDTLQKSPDFKNADYLFRSPAIVAELKCLVENKAEDINIKSKIQERMNRWMANGIIPPIYGKIRIQSKTLPEHCQHELIDLYKPPIQRRINKANKQIKATLDHLKICNGKGLLILVNDGNYALEANAVLYLLNRILGKQFRYINSVVYLTVNMYGSSPLTLKPTLVWVHAFRPDVPPIDSAFVNDLFRGWRIYLEKAKGEIIEEIWVNNNSAIKQIKYIK